MPEWPIFVKFKTQKGKERASQESKPLNQMSAFAQFQVIMFLIVNTKILSYLGILCI